MRRFGFGLLILSVLALNTYAGTISLGTASPFGVLGEAGVTNTGPSIIHGSVAGSAGTPAVTGFPPGIVVAPGVLYTTGVANSGPGTPFGDASAAYTTAQGLPGATPIFTDLGGLTLGSGVYSLGAAQLTGTLLLDAEGSYNASWTFQIASSLTTASASSVEVIDAGSAGPFTGSITWAVTSGATLGTTTTFLGTIISNAKTALNTGATIGCGRAISLSASVTLDTNVIDTGCTVTAGTGGPGGGGTITPPTPVPEGGSTLLYLGFLLVPIGTMRAFRRRSV